MGGTSRLPYQPSSHLEKSTRCTHFIRCYFLYLGSCSGEEKPKSIINKFRLLLSQSGMLRCGGTNTTLASHSQAQTRVGSPFMGGGAEVALKAPGRPAGSVRGEAGGGTARSGGDPWEVPDPDRERPGGRPPAGLPC